MRREVGARGLASAKPCAADAEADQIEVASKARAEAIRREAQALRGSPELIQLRIAEKWNGALPQVSGGEALPLLNLDAVGAGKR